MTASVVIPPAAALVLGGLLLPLLPAALRRPAILVLPLVTLLLIWQVPDGLSLKSSFLGYELAAEIEQVVAAIAYVGGAALGLVRRRQPERGAF